MTPGDVAPRAAPQVRVNGGRIVPAGEETMPGPPVASAREVAFLFLFFLFERKFEEIFPSRYISAIINREIEFDDKSTVKCQKLTFIKTL